MIRLGLIGAGPWGSRYVPSAHEAGNCIVTHVAGDPKALRGTPHIDGLEVIESSQWRQLLNAPVDAFIIATPPDTHSEIASDLLRAGRPVMVEKPMALTLDEAKRISFASKQSGAPLLVNHQHLYAPAYEELLSKAIGSGWLSIASAGGSVGPHRSYSALWDYGPHDVSMFLGVGYWLGGKTRMDRAEQIDGSFTLSLSRPNSACALHVWNDHGPKTRAFAVLGNRGLIVYDDINPSGHKLWWDGQPLHVSKEKPLTRAVRFFADAVKRGTNRPDWRMDPDFGVEVVRVLSLAEQWLELTRAKAS